MRERERKCFRTRAQWRSRMKCWKKRLLTTWNIGICDVRTAEYYLITRFAQLKFTCNRHRARFAPSCSLNKPPRALPCWRYFVACKRFDANANGSCQQFFFPLLHSGGPYSNDRLHDIGCGPMEGLISYLFKLAIRLCRGRTQIAGCIREYGGINGLLM